jgi:hypothetical protein
MARASDPLFRTHHALRIKGFATIDTVAEVAGHDMATVDGHLRDLQNRGLTQFREARALWQLTADGKAAHAEALAADVAGADLAALHPTYSTFLGINDDFKVLCTDWQLRNGEPNDHSDAAYDASIIERLVALDGTAQPVVGSLGDHFDRLGGYSPRLAGTCRKVLDGETKMLTGVMCGSYHDVWMELHEDLILTQGIDRAKEGSF